MVNISSVIDRLARCFVVLSPLPVQPTRIVPSRLDTAKTWTLCLWRSLVKQKAKIPLSVYDLENALSPCCRILQDGRESRSVKDLVYLHSLE